MMLDRAEVERYLSIAREVGRTRRLYDLHVSPYEVIFGAFDYRPDTSDPGVYGLEGASYRTPTIGALRVGGPMHAWHVDAVPSALSLSMYKRVYAHVGPRVFADHMLASGISTSLLIPVARAGGDTTEQFRLMFDMYRGDKRFAFAYCTPDTVPTSAIVGDVQRVRSRYAVSALKVHPNIQAIDVATSPGRERIRQMLAASASTGLPLMVHGGLSNVLVDPRSREFATLDNLMSIDWRDADQPVIIGHAGLFGYPSAEISGLLQTLEGILATNDNVVVDVSGLEFDALCAVLRRIDDARIVFGSDALYFPQWSAVVKLLCAVESLGMPVAKTFAKLAGSNPERVLGRHAADH